MFRRQPKLVLARKGSRRRPHQPRFETFWKKYRQMISKFQKPTSASNRKSKPQVAPSKPMRKFRQRATIGQEDLLSRLPSDCLNPILYMMNQWVTHNTSNIHWFGQIINFRYELNVLSTASQTLYAATVIARPKSIKRRFANITISQVWKLIHLQLEYYHYIVVLFSLYCCLQLGRYIIVVLA